MSPLPTTIQIGPLRSTVAEDTRITDAAGCWGRIEHSAQTITLDPEQAADFRAVTLLHEVLHGCWQAAQRAAHGGDEERIVSALTPILVDTLRRNPALVACLLDHRSIVEP